MNTTRLILDTNQASSIYKNEAPLDFDPIIVVPPLTWAEMLNGSRQLGIKLVQAVAQYKVLFGMDLTSIHNHLANFTESEIQSFEPIYPDDSDEHLCRLLTLHKPTELHFKRAKELKQQSIEHAASFETLFSENKKQERDKKSRGEAVEQVRFVNLKDAMQQLFYGSEPLYRAGFVQMVTDDGTLPLKSKTPESFFDAVLKNPMLRRCLCVHAIISLGYAGVWNDAQFNVSVSQNRNDVADTHLPIYARDGDTILTEDAMLRRAFREADPKKAVKLATWTEVIGLAK
jgi:hypothetical protein